MQEYYKLVREADEALKEYAKIGNCCVYKGRWFRFDGFHWWLID